MVTRLTVQQQIDRSTSESAWQTQVQHLAQAHGWRYYHAPDNRPVTAASGRRYVQNIRAGFPDLVLVRGPRLIFAELKRELGPVSSDQTDWLDALRATGAEAYLWRPSDRPHVEAVLARAGAHT